MILHMGESNVAAIRKVYGKEIPGRSDLVCYWFAQATRQVEAKRLTRAGLVATNSISGGNNLPTLKLVADHTVIWEAWRDESWVLDGAAVRVAMVMFGNPPSTKRTLDGAHVDEILSTLRSGVALSRAVTLNENRGISFIGTQKKRPV
jgi:hypothetical protein